MKKILIFSSLIFLRMANALDLTYDINDKNYFGTIQVCDFYGHCFSGKGSMRLPDSKGQFCVTTNPTIGPKRYYTAITTDLTQQPTIEVHYTDTGLSFNPTNATVDKSPKSGPCPIWG